MTSPKAATASSIPARITERLPEQVAASRTEWVERDSAAAGRETCIEATHSSGKAAAAGQYLCIAGREPHRAFVRVIRAGEVERPAIEVGCQRKVTLSEFRGEFERLARISLRLVKVLANGGLGRPLRGVTGERLRSARERECIVRIQTDSLRVRGDSALKFDARGPNTKTLSPVDTHRTRLDSASRPVRSSCLRHRVTLP